MALQKTAVIIAAVVAAGMLWAQRVRINTLRSDRDKYRENAQTLLTDVEQYTIRDSLNASRIGTLTLRLAEYERFRADDAALIRDLQAKNRDLRAVTTAQTETITKLRAEVRDSVIIRDTVEVPVRCFEYSDTWLDVSGCFDGAEFVGDVVSRDSLLFIESVRYKRFLWWKRKKIKDRDFRAVSRNPHTKIVGFEVVTVEK